MRIVLKMKKRLDSCNILGRDNNLENYYVEDAESGIEYFNLTEFCNPVSGPIAGKYEYREGYNGWGFLCPRGRTGQVIAFKENKICVGVSARHIFKDAEPSIDNDRLYIGTYLIDSAESPEMVPISIGLALMPTIWI